MANRWGNNGNSDRLYLFWALKSLQMVIAAMKLKDANPWQKSHDQPRQHIKKQRHCFANKGPSTRGYGFSSSHVWMWELDYEESWVQKNWCFRTVVLEKTLESPLDCKEIQPVHPKGNQSWIVIGRTDVEAVTPIFWPPDAMNWLICKDPDAGKDWRWEEKRDDRKWDGVMALPTLWTWIWVNSGVGDGQGGLMCYSPQGHEKSDTTEWLNWTDIYFCFQNLYKFHSKL